MASITTVAKQFFEACETGKGWQICREYCTPKATFAAQAEPLGVKSFATDDERNSVCAYGVFSGTHSGQDGPCPPTGKSTSTEYVYVMEFEGDKIRHMTKIWNAGLAMKDLGWI